MPIWDIELEDGQTLQLESDTEPSDEEIYAALSRPAAASAPRPNLGEVMQGWPAQDVRAFVPTEEGPAAPGSSWIRRGIGDPLTKLAQGVVELPQAAVGLADIPTLGWAGKAVSGETDIPLTPLSFAEWALKNLGSDITLTPKFKPTVEAIGELLSPEAQAAQQEFARAKGVLPKIEAAVEHPSVIAGTIMESLPATFAGGAAGRVALKGLGAAAPFVGGAVGEGLLSAGQTAEQVRGETATGTLTPAQSALAAVSGALTTAFGLVGGRFSKLLGLSDVDTMLARGLTREAVTEAASKNMPLFKEVIGSMVSEGLIEELPQSLQEQVAQNLSLGKPWDEGLTDAGVLGTFAGMAMGAGATVSSRGLARLAEEGGDKYAKETGAATKTPGQEAPPIEEANRRLRLRDTEKDRVEAQATTLSLEDEIIQLQNDPEVTGQRLVRMEAGKPVYEPVIQNTQKVQRLQQLLDQAFQVEEMTPLPSEPSTAEAPAPTVEAPRGAVQAATPAVEYVLSDKQSSAAQTKWEQADEVGQGVVVGDRTELVGTQWSELTPEEQHYIALQTGAKRPRGGKAKAIQEMHVAAPAPIKAIPSSPEEADQLIREYTTLRDFERAGRLNNRQAARLRQMVESLGLSGVAPEDAAYIIKERMALEERAGAKVNGETPKIEVSSEADPNSPFAPSRIESGTGAPENSFMVYERSTNRILINAGKMARWRDAMRQIGMSPAQTERAFQSMVAEEVIHGQTDPAAAEAYWRAMTQIAREIFKRRYALGGEIPERPDAIWGMEALRFRQQQAMRMTPTEFTQMTISERIGWGALDVLERSFRAIRETLTTVGKEQARLFATAFTNIQSAKNELEKTPEVSPQLEMFYDETVVSENGEPVVFYHGSPESGIKPGELRPPIFVSPSRNTARTYMGLEKIGKEPASGLKRTGALYATHIKFSNPMIWTGEKGIDVAEARRIFETTDHDAIINRQNAEYVLRDPSQVRIVETTQAPAAPAIPGKAEVTEENIDQLTTQEYQSMRHRDGIQYGITLSEKDVPRLEKQYDKWTKAILEATKAEDQNALYEAFGKSIFYGGALQGATRGKHAAAGGNYDVWVAEQAAVPGAPARGMSKKAQAAAEERAKYFAAMEKKAAGEGVESLLPPMEQVTPNQMPKFAGEFLDTTDNLTLNAFKRFMQKRGFAAEPAQLRTAFADSIGEALVKAPGSKIKAVLEEMGLVKEVTGGGRIIGDISDPPTQAAPPAVQPEEIKQPGQLLLGILGKVPIKEVPSSAKLMKAVEKELKRRGYEPAPPGRQRFRNKAIGAILHDIFFRTSDQAEGLFRKEITPDEMADALKFQNVFARIPRYQQKSAELGAQLTADARTHGKNVEDSKRIVVMENDKTGSVDMLSIWNEGEKRRGVLVRNPGVSDAPTQYATMLKTHTPLFTVLLNRPVRRFRKQFKNRGEFLREFGNEAMNIVQETFAEEMPGEYQQTGFTPNAPTAAGEEAPLTTGVSMRAAPGETMPAPGELGVRQEGEIREGAGMVGPNAVLGRALFGIGRPALRLTRISDAEAGHIFDQLQFNNYNNSDQLRQAIDTIRDLAQDRPITQLPLQFISGVSKLVKSVLRRNPDFNDIDALRVVGQILLEEYEDAKSNPATGREQFVRRILGYHSGQPLVASGAVTSGEGYNPVELVAFRPGEVAGRTYAGKPVQVQRPQRVGRGLPRPAPPVVDEAEVQRRAQAILDQYLKEEPTSSVFERVILSLSPEVVGREALEEIKQEVPRKKGESRQDWIDRVREFYGSEFKQETLTEKAATEAERMALYKEAAWQAQFGDITGKNPEEGEAPVPGAPARNVIKTGGDVVGSLTWKPVIAGLRIGSEWMVDRLRRLTPVQNVRAQNILSGFNSIISMTQRESGRMFAGFGDAMLKAAGRNNKAVRWMNDVQTVVPFGSAVMNSIEAIEGRIHPPDYAVELNTMAQESNYLVGKNLEPVVPGFIANGGMTRLLNSFGFDIIRLGHGEYYKRFIEGIAVANRTSVANVRKQYNKLHRLLIQPRPNLANVFKVNQEITRKFPVTVSHIWVGPKNRLLGHWEPVLHAELFDYFNHGIRRAAMYKAFRSAYPIYLPGQKPPQAKTVRSDFNTLDRALGGKWAPLIDTLYRAIQGHPSDNLVQTGTRLPLSIASDGGWAMRAAQPIGQTLRAMWLTKQVALQLGELGSGASPIFFGFRRSAIATIKRNMLYSMLEANGAVDRILYNNAWSRHSPIRDAFRVFNNTLQRVTFQNVWNELQEAQAAGAAYFLAEKIRGANTPGSGVKLNWSEKLYIPQSFRAMGFTQLEVNRMMKGDPLLLGQMVRKAASFASGGHAHPAESSRLLADRGIRKLLWFQKYPATRTNQLLKILGLMAEGFRTKNGKQLLGSSYLLARFVGFAANQGLLQTMFVAAFTGGLYAAALKLKEFEDDRFGFTVDMFRSAISGPAQLVTSGWERGGFLGVANNMKRQFAPFNIAKDMWDLANGEGFYRNQDLHDRIGTYLNRNMPITRAARTAAAWVGLSEYDYKLNEAGRAFRNWQIDKWPNVPGTPTIWMNDETGKAFRTNMRKAVEALKRGDVEAQLKAISDAIEAKIESGETMEKSIQSVKASFRGARLLVNPKTREALTPEEMDSLYNRIGGDALERLMAYDAMLMAASDQLSQ